MKLMMAKNPMAGESLEGVGDFEDILADSGRMESGIWIPGIPEKYSHCNGAEDCGDAWHV